MTVGALVVLLGCGVVLVGLERCLFVCVRVDVRACIYTGDRSTTRCSTHTESIHLKKSTCLEHQVSILQLGLGPEGHLQQLLQQPQPVLGRDEPARWIGLG